MEQTLVNLFEESVKKYAERPFLFEKITDRFQETTYKQTRAQVYCFGAGLRAIGVNKNDAMALLSEGRNWWIMGELAMFYAGAVNVPLSIKLEESNDLLFRLQHADVKYIMVSGNQLPKIRTIIDQLPAVQKVIVFDEQEVYADKEVFIEEVLQAGDRYLKEHSEEEFLEIAKSLKNDDLATITYTSGTTAEPKGVMLTHRNYTANIEQALTLLIIPETWRTLVILPLDHCFAHVAGFYIFMKCGAGVATVQVGKSPLETLRNIPVNIKEIKPHMILSVPALAKNFRKNIENGVRAQGKSLNRLFHLALKVAYIYNQDGWNKGAGWRCVLKPLVTWFDSILFSKLRESFGGNLQFFVGGGALLDKDLQQFYYAIGIPMFQGYGLSEATPIISSNIPVSHKFGSSGVLVQPLDIKILDSDGKELPAGEKGEIVIRGENVMAGYWKNPVSTADTVKEGWLYTGDMGYMSSDGYLYVLGRFKSLLIGSDGEKYSPEGIEEALVSMTHHIDQVVLHNNQDAYTTALLVPNKEALKRHIKHAPDSPEGRKEAVQLLVNEINKFRAGGVHAGMFPERWLPTTFAILPEPFTEQNHMVNSTMKVVRGKVEEIYAETIDFLYTAEGKNMLNERNLQNIF
ncbi:AMP-dependent synthetase/ligase [Paludibacter jiangxiensis]|uniref:Long-chain acyl-CoA synthetase n=1 Tax=Paludibacter jiangxiensis TaxID=681398 RepID=A0A161M5S6_9BACT|nr:AMP-binding protein [Paludibacter jiangxiensis]GAT63823.1 long-chain acyl-CoA synthetase [Paludibacter jiangxiensis]